MKKRQFLATALCALFASGAIPSDAPGQRVANLATSSPMIGGWEGEADTGKWPLFLNIEIEGGGERLGGKLKVLGQTALLSAVAVQGEAFTIRVGTNLILEGRLEGDALVGRLEENGKTNYPFSLRRVAAYPKPNNRVEAWAQDLDALEKRFLPADRSFSPGERALFLEALADLRADLPKLTDAQVTMRMASAIAIAKNPHTRLYLLRNRTELRRMPIRLWWFSDGLYVVRAREEHRKLLGCRVDLIGGKPTRLARDMVAPAFAGTPSWIDYKSVYSLTSPEALQGMGVTAAADSVEYGLSGCAAAGRVTLKPLPLVRSQDAVEAWWDLSPVHPSAGEGWVQALQSSKSKLPLYLRHPTLNYWFEYLPASGVVYFQYNRSSNAAEESTEAFGKRLLAALDQHPVKALVIDYRFNTGGNLNLGADLMKKLQERTKGMQRWIITGRSTFSAGITHVASWREAGDVTIVGEPVGDTMEFWSEGGNIKLPNSGYDAHFANGRHSYSPKPCPEGIYCYGLDATSIEPDIYVTSSWAEYRVGRDPAMSIILDRAR
jgi:hypothetical protein